MAAIKTWNVTSDKPRPSHDAMDGESVGIDETFSNGLKYPGDPDGDEDETAGCSCILDIEVTSEPGDSESDDSESGDDGTSTPEPPDQGSEQSSTPSAVIGAVAQGIAGLAGGGSSGSNAAAGIDDLAGGSDEEDDLAGQAGGGTISHKPRKSSVLDTLRSLASDPTTSTIIAELHALA